MASFVFRSRDRAAFELIDDCVEQAQQVRREYEPGWHENWSNYRVESNAQMQQPTKLYPLAGPDASRFRMSPVNFLKTPESHQVVNTLRSLLLASLFGTRDYIQADPVGDEDVEAATRVSKLLMYGLERPGNFRTNYENLGDALIFGLGSYTARWDHRVRLVPRRMPVPDTGGGGDMLRDPETQAIKSVLVNVKVPVKDDPALESDDLFDTWFDPAADRADQLNWKIKRFRIRDEELEALRDDENWDADGIAKVLEKPPGGRQSGPDSDDHPKLMTENLTQEDIKDVSKYGYYGGWSFDGAIPKDVADELKLDPDGNVLLKVINGVVVQSMQSPQRQGLINGGTVTVLPTGRGIYGLSPLTVVRYLQDVSDTQLILTVQALIESVYQNYLVGGEVGNTFKRQLETRRPREVFTLQGDIDQVAPLPKDYNGLQIAVGALNLISQTIRNATNARDPVQGQVSQAGGGTATEYLGVTDAAVNNVDQLAILIERDELPVQGRLINDLFYVHLEDEGKVFRRVGDTEPTTVNYLDIDVVSDINFIGARSALSRQAKASQFRDFASMLASNPMTLASTDWHALVKRYGDEALEIKGLEQLMIQDPEEIVARLQSMGLPQTMGAQMGGAGAGGGAPNSKGRRTPGSGGATGGATPTQAAGEPS